MEYTLHFLTIVAIFIPLALSLNLLVGHMGALSLMHASFYGIGAYATAILTTTYHQGFMTSLIASATSALVVGTAIAFLLHAVHKERFTILTIGLSFIVTSLFLNLSSITGGAFGISGIPRPELFGTTLTSPISFFLFVGFTSLILSAALHVIGKQHFGRILNTIREDEKILTPFLYRPKHFKILAFTISATFAALAGSLYASYTSFIDPSLFSFSESILILTMILLGGLASSRGVIVGVLVILLLPEGLRFFGVPNGAGAEIRTILMGFAILYLVYKHPKGIFGNYAL